MPPILRWIVACLTALFLAIVATLLAVAVNVATATDLPAPLAAISANPWLAVVVLTILGAALTLVGSLIFSPSTEAQASTGQRGYGRRDVERIRHDILADLRQYAAGASQSMTAGQPAMQLPCRLSRLRGAVQTRWPAATALQDGPLAVDVVAISNGGETSFLLLGRQGQGKTTELLRVLLALRQIAEADTSARIPLLIDLQGWSETSEKSFRDWIIRQIAIRFGLPGRLTEQWIEERKLIFLLDGLDEVPAVARSACVQAINHFRNLAYRPPVVVTCRVDEYQSLDAKLELDDAVVIQPLRRQDVRTVIASIPTCSGLLAALNDDEFSSFLDNPLMVILAIEAFRDRSVDEILSPTGADRHQYRLLDAYVSSSIDNRPCLGLSSPAEHEALIRRLRVLAAVLREQNSLTLFPERLETRLLREGLVRTITPAAVAVLSGALVVLASVACVRVFVAVGRSLPFGVDPGADFGDVVGINLGLTVGLAVATQVYGARLGHLERLEWTWPTLRRHLWAVAAAAILAGMAVGAADIFVNGTGSGTIAVAVVNGLLTAIVCMIAFALVGGADTAAILRPTETWRGSTETLRTARGGAMVYGLAAGLVGGLAFGPASLVFAGIPISPSGFYLATQVTGLARPAAVVASSSIASLVIVGMIAALASGVGDMSAPSARARLRRLAIVGSLFGILGVLSASLTARSNDRSLVALAIGKGGGWLDAVTFGGIGGNISALLGGIAVGAAGTLGGWLLFGGSAQIEQRSLRLALALQGRLPIDLQGFLFHAENHGLLIAVRGGYAFRSEVVRDYFADRGSPSTGTGP